MLVFVLLLGAAGLRCGEGCMSMQPSDDVVGPTCDRTNARGLAAPSFTGGGVPTCGSGQALMAIEAGLVVAVSRSFLVGPHRLL